MSPGPAPSAPRRPPAAVWVCGGAVSGKSSIAAAALEGLGFRLVDVDVAYEELLGRYGLRAADRGGEGDAQDTRLQQAVRRVGEGLMEELAAGGEVDPGAFVAGLEAAVAAGRLDSYHARRLTAVVRERVGEGPVAAEAFRRAVLPRMSDWDDLHDYLAAQEEVTAGHLWAVAEELNRRDFEAARAAGEDLLIVETGGRSGHLLRRKQALEAEGYGAFLVWVSVARAADAVRRNQGRADAGGRRLDPAAVRSSFRAAARARRRLLPAFEPRVLVIDNSRDGPDALAACAQTVRRRIEAWLAAAEGAGGGGG